MENIFNAIAKMTRIQKTIIDAKKIPPSPPLHDKNQESEIEDVYSGPGGKGMFMKLKGHPQPFPGYPAGEAVMVLESLKRLIPMAVDYLYPVLQKHFLKPEKYSKPVREVYRLFDILIARMKYQGTKERWAKIRDMVCFGLEFDSAYRFWFQDILKEIDLEQIKMDENEEHYFKNRDDYIYGAYPKK